jgi:hypothetical protein
MTPHLGMRTTKQDRQQQTRHLNAQKRIQWKENKSPKNRKNANKKKLIPGIEMVLGLVSSLISSISIVSGPFGLTQIRSIA